MMTELWTVPLYSTPSLSSSITTACILLSSPHSNFCLFPFLPSPLSLLPAHCCQGNSGREHSGIKRNMMKYKMKGLKMVQAKKVTFGLLKPGKLVDVTTLMFRRPLTPKMHLGDYYGYFIAVVPLLFFVSSFAPFYQSFIQSKVLFWYAGVFVFYILSTLRALTHTLGPCHWQTLVVRLNV